jgi:Domain of unknown function (DUF4440)
MRTLTLTLILLAAASTAPALAGSEVGDYSSLPKDLAAAATAYDLAQFKVDRPELVRWLADDYTIVDIDGRAKNKAEAIADATSPDSKTPYVALSQPIFKVWPNGAVLAGVVDARGTDHGKPFKFVAHFSDVWAKRDGRWQVVFSQITLSH